MAEAGRYVSQQAENEIGRLKEVAQQHVQETRDHRQEILHLREAAEKQAYELQKLRATLVTQAAQAVSVHGLSSDRPDPVEKPLRFKRKGRYPIFAPSRV